MKPKLSNKLNFQDYIDFSNQFYQDLLGYKPKQTFLEQVPENKWGEFARQRGLNQNSSGIYLPRNQMAVIQEKNPLSLFHEYFGHGLYCEQSLQGIKLLDLEKNLLEEEKQEFQGRKFSLEDVQKFRATNKTFQKLDELRKQNLTQYEIFAIWTEYLLSGENNLRNEFGKKYDSLLREEKEAIDSIINFSEQYGNLATFYASGLARRTNQKRVKKLLEEIYGNKEINNSKLVLLTGSKKSFSDIDLFVSSNYLQTIKNNWLDLVVFNEEDFERRIRLFEIQVTLPIIEGEFVIGDENYLEQKRIQLQKQSITKEAIQHNFQKSKEQKQRALEYPENSEERNVGLSYSKTYLINALALNDGKRIFTNENLVKYSQNKRFIELKKGLL